MQLPSARLGLLIAPFTSNLLSLGPCFSNNFFGTYRDANSWLSVFNVSDTSCVEIWDSELGSAHYVQAPEAGRSLVWLEKVDIDQKLEDRISNSETALGDFWLALQQQSTTELQEVEQKVVSTDKWLSTGYDVHYLTESAALISLDVSTAKVVDTLLPPFWRSILLPENPVQHVAANSDSVEVVRNILSQVKFDPVVASIVNNISLAQIKNDIRFLTGEDKQSGIESRHSFSSGALVAALWLKERVEGTGAICKLEPFLVGFAPNVICRYTSTKETNAIVLISGHYDSRGSFGSTRAPGANDDGSGTAGVLSIARAIGRKGVKFHSNVELAFFAGEEQGLIGSRAYALQLRRAGANVTLMVQADMIAYHAFDEPPQLGLPARFATPEVTQLVGNISNIYSPELTVGYTSVCCSDHQSFFELGFPSTQVFERAGSIADPMYHNSGDLSDREGYDFKQLLAIARVQFATLLHTAGFEF